MAKKKKKKVVSKRPKESGDNVPGSKEPAPRLENFEESLRALEQAVSDLESGNLTLADSLEKYENGVNSLKTCHQILENAEERIRLLTGIDAEGRPQTSAFDTQQTELLQRSEKRSSAVFDESLAADSDLEESENDDELDELESDESVEGDSMDDNGSLF